MPVGFLKKLFWKKKPANPHIHAEALEIKPEDVGFLREEVQELREEEKESFSEAQNHAMRVLEAALFMSANPLSFEDFLKLSTLGVQGTRTALNALIDAFNGRDSALEIIEDAGGYRMRVRPHFGEHVSHLAAESEFGKGIMKTLAFIAYKQPVLQSTLVKVRSNKAYDHLKVLEEKGFVSKAPKGRSFVVRTTQKFVQYFGEKPLKLTPIDQVDDSRKENG